MGEGMRFLMMMFRLWGMLINLDLLVEVLRLLLLALVERFWR